MKCPFKMTSKERFGCDCEGEKCALWLLVKDQNDFGRGSRKITSGCALAFTAAGQLKGCEVAVNTLSD